MSGPVTSFSILQSYYPHVSRLSDFILLTLRDEDKDAFARDLVTDSDSTGYTNFVHNSYVGCQVDAAWPNHVSLDLLGNDMQSVSRAFVTRRVIARVLTFVKIIEAVQRQALQRKFSWNKGPKTKPGASNLLTYGYTYKVRALIQAHTSDAHVYKFEGNKLSKEAANSSVDYLRNEHWRKLLSR